MSDIGSVTSLGVVLNHKAVETAAAGRQEKPHCSSAHPGQMSTREITASEQIVSSCTGAVLTSVMMTPFDVVKTRLQAQNQPGFYGSALRTACTYCGGLETSVCPSFGPVQQVPCERPRLNGTLDAFVKISKYEGMRNLWRGLSPTLVMAVPATVIYFTIYDNLKPVFGTGLWAPVLAGSSSRVVAATVISPVEMIRTRMQATSGNGAAEVIRTVRQLVRADGYRTLFRGLGPTLLRDVPFSGLYWLCYEELKRKLPRAFQGTMLAAGAVNIDTAQEPPFHISFIAGAMSGTLAATITLPFDVVKTRQQSTIGEALRKGSSVGAKPESAAYIVRDIVTRYGWHGLFVGLAPRLAKVAPACAIMISTYEYFKRFFKTRGQMDLSLDT